MFDVLVYLFEHQMDAENEVLDQDSLRTDLQLAGFLDSEVNRALNWLESLIVQIDNQQPLAALETANSIRIYTEQEKELLDVECRGFLHFLENCGVLDHTMRELVIERFTALDREDMSIEQLKWVVLMVLFNQPGNEAAYAWMEELVYASEEVALH